MADETVQPTLTAGEHDLLQWLGLEDVSQYGECHGANLDRLISLGLAQVHGPETETDNPFIAKGQGVMFRAVSLTPAGRARLRTDAPSNDP